MSALVCYTDEKWETGEIVWVDTVGKAQKADPTNLTLVLVGVCINPPAGNSTNGRMWFAINGIPYYTNDMLLWGEDLTTTGAENTSFIPFNPFDPGFVVVIYTGMSSILKTQTNIPVAWKKLRTGTVYDWYLVC